uniref:Serine-threonine kinase receptor-associated protein n=1 Tax=Fibrocapsa japonica TaxID=94617 RepID=A0A7S2XYA9_9STRA|mmetsp:Transcript_2119/g.3103  ORF Transcript_2119/g.3103 Transcript_2119/m.3103 type:complete len:318 (+) Transcript_2119:130-1083(+)|eukprot:CAMPEP_0113940994 /NCGR_PEP_ID=MMETSP1339-20121228/7009_1 /TAXON_ID=94617 /ORGANISM="Fibrocapsa japonica" /LENGTH=317 /DNA_ID=CAMNT_0000945011 /DNA_START=34 /DNA_END=987 /DNA_ORIENTATION=+ /assembly_acc=CAM_ASM_000762
MDQQTRQIPIVCPGHSRPLSNVHYSAVTPDGFFLISGCLDKLPMLRRGDTGDWIGTFEGHKGAVWCAKLDNDATLAATASGDFSAKLWNAISGEEMHQFVHRHIVKTVEFAPDRSKLISGGQEGLLRIFDLSRPEADPDQANHKQPDQQGSLAVTKAVWGAEADLVVTGTSDGTVRTWDLRSLGDGPVKEVSVEGAVMDMEMSRDSRTVTVAAGTQVNFLSAEDLSVLKAHQMPVNFREEGGASLHPDKTKFIAGGSDLWVRVFDYETGQELECHKGHHGPVRCLRYSPDGGSYATGSEDGTIRIWQTTLKPATSSA